MPVTGVYQFFYSSLPALLPAVTHKPKKVRAPLSMSNS